MKKFFVSFLSVILTLQFMSSCDLVDSDDDNDRDDIELKLKDFIKINNASYKKGTFPLSTSYESLSDVSVEQNEDGTVTLLISKDDYFVKYFIGVKNVEGYYVFTPQNSVKSRKPRHDIVGVFKSAVRKSKKKIDDEDEFDEDEYFIIPLNVGSEVKDDFEIIISGETRDGEITEPYEATINVENRQSEEHSVSISLVMWDEDGRKYSWKMYDLDYDTEGRLNYLSMDQEMMDDEYDYGYSKMYIKYSPLNIKIEEYSEEDGLYEVSFNNISQNAAGYIEKAMLNTPDGKGEVEFYYDSDGHLLSVDFLGLGDMPSLYKFNWSEGNLISWSAEYDGEPDLKCYYSYGNQANKKNQLTVSTIMTDPFSFGLYHSGLFGKLSKNMVNYVKFDDGEDEYDYDYNENEWNISYNFNSDGTINSETLSSYDEGDLVKNTYVYSY